MKSICRALLVAVVIWGLILVIMTEFLSLFHLISFGGLLTSWISIIAIVTIWIIYRGCKWWSDNSDLLFEDDEHKQDVMVALGSLAHFNVQIFISSFPSFSLLFENFIDVLHGNTHIDDDD